MSYMEQVQQLGPNEYLLPRVGGMKVEVRAFLSEKLFAQTDEALWRQAAEVSCMPGAIGMYLLPDTHLGYHLPVGGVLVTEDVLVQAGSGYDISCGIVHLQVPGLSADEDLGKLYWAWHNAAANYAVANRWTIVEGVNDALEEVFGVRGAPFFEISHNLVQEETLVLPDGTTKKGFVHRKGATRAFPAGHPDLVGSKWEASGHPCLIPGSMFDGAAILMPLQGAYRSGCSVNHGSGRVMGRGHAKRELKVLHDDIDAEMQNVVRSFGPDQVKIRGVLSNTRRTPLDECHHVYKDLDDVLAVLEDEGIAKVERRLWPVANLKGTD